MIVNFDAFLIGVSVRENKNNPEKPYYSCSVMQGADNPVSVDISPELFEVLKAYQKSELSFKADYIHFFYNGRWITRLVIVNLHSCINNVLKHKFFRCVFYLFHSRNPSELIFGF